MSKKRLPRGIRLHNPGLLRRDSTPWQGLADAQPDPEFWAFQGPAWGIRALARNLITYQDKHGVRTVRRIITRWAPPQGDRNGPAPGGEYMQDTGAYISHVADRMGVHPDAELDMHDYADLRPLVEAIIAHENAGYAYPAAVVDKGLALAGVVPATPRSLQKSRTVKGAQTAAGAGVVATATGAIAAVGPAVPVLREIAAFARAYPHELLIAVGLLAIAGAAYAAYAKWDDRRRGIA